MTTKPELEGELANFREEGGEKRILDTLCENKAVSNNREVAETIATKGKLVGFKAGATVIEQGDSSDSVFFLISGKVDILRDGSKIADRAAPNQVGEIAATTLGTKHTASVVVTSSTLVAIEVSGNDFRGLLKRPSFQRELAKEMQSRHVQRIEVPRETKDDSLFWVATSVIAAVVSGFSCWVIASNMDIDGLERAIMSIVTALLAFIAVSLLNPAYFFKRVAAVMALAMLTLLVADIKLDLVWAIGATEYQFRFQRESPPQEPLTYVLLFCTCALFIWADRKQS